jgi:hypothetical protein
MTTSMEDTMLVRKMPCRRKQTKNRIDSACERQKIETGHSNKITARARAHANTPLDNAKRTNAGKQILFVFSSACLVFSSSDRRSKRLRATNLIQSSRCGNPKNRGSRGTKTSTIIHLSFV